MNLRIQGYKEARKMPVKIGETPASGTLSLFQNLIESAFFIRFLNTNGLQENSIGFCDVSERDVAISRLDFQLLRSGRWAKGMHDCSNCRNNDYSTHVLICQ